MPHTGDDSTSFEGWIAEGHLGYGGFGTVLKGRLKDGTPVAVKVMDKHDLVAVHEADLMSPLKHENIVKCFGHRDIKAKGRSNTKVEIFMELCTPLRDVWTDTNQSNVDLIRDYTRQVVLGLQYLHDKKIAHHSIKLDNVLIGGDGMVKIADFGCSKAMSTLTMQRGGRQQEMSGTPSHMAPEIVAQWCDGEYPHYGVKADVWALGCLVLELHGRQPWTFDPECINYPCAQIWRKFKMTEGFPENAPKQGECTPELWDFYSRVFERDPAKRATCAELLECDWLRVSSVEHATSAAWGARYLRRFFITPLRHVATYLTSSVVRFSLNTFLSGDGTASFEGWIIEGHLGYGGFGTVLKGRLKDGTPVAVKVMDKHELVEIREADLMTGLQHKHIVKCFGHREIEAKGVGNARVEIFMELCTPLRDVWTDTNQSNFELIRDYTRQVVLGLQYLHDRKIAHHDIKLVNVLIDGDGMVKIADFGCSKTMSTLTMGAGGRQQEIAGTPSHMAPEIVANVLEGKDPHYGVKADVWALGCLVLELHGKEPWTTDPKYCNNIIFQYSLKHRDSPNGFPENAPKQGECTPELWDFYSRVFERDPARRATCAELLECDWLRVSSVDGNS